MAIQPIPEGYHSVTPYLIVSGAEKAIDFYKRAFAATEVLRFPGPGGRLMHAEIQIGDSRVMLADELPERGYRAPRASDGTPVSMMLYVSDVDAVFARALAEGAKVVKPVEDQFYGDRTGTLSDPFGHVWTVGTHKEEVEPEEMKRRFDALMSKSKAATA